MIGAGAKCCEYLKIFSMMGISASKDDKVTITDDLIWISIFCLKKYIGFNNMKKMKVWIKYLIVKLKLI